MFRDKTGGITRLFFNGNLGKGLGALHVTIEISTTNGTVSTEERILWYIDLVFCILISIGL